MNLEFNHNERYNALIKDGNIEVIDTFVNAPILKIAETDLNKSAISTTCLLLNSYWKEIISLRKSVSGK